MAHFTVDLYAEDIQVTADTQAGAEEFAREDLALLEKEWDWTDYEVEPTDSTEGFTKYDVIIDTTREINPDSENLWTFMGKRTCIVTAGSEQGALFAALEQVGKTRLDRKRPPVTPAKPKREPEEHASQNRQDQARLLFETQNWSSLWYFKRTCKKTWEQLGFNYVEQTTIENSKPAWV